MSNQYVTKIKRDQLEDRMKKLGIQEGDLVEKFILGAGKGGQKVNKTCSCVYLNHLPTGINVKCQKERSRALNRFTARKTLCDLFEERILKKATERQKKAEKIKRQKRRRSRKQKQKMLEEKKKQGDKKKARKPVRMDE